MVEFNGKQFNCAVEMTVGLIGGKWKIPILWHLAEGILRFSELQKKFPQITQKVLTQQLRDLEKDGLIIRKVYPQVPPKVEYTLTDLGQSLIPLLHAVNNWGTEYVKASQFRHDVTTLFENEETGIAKIQPAVQPL